MSKMKKIYHLIVYGENFKRGILEYTNFPTDEEMVDAIKKFDGISVRVEERYKLIEVE